MNVAVANRTVDKPAKVTTLKFPGRAPFLLFGSTVFYSPAWFAAFPSAVNPGYQKIHLPLHSGRDCTPALFIAVDGLQGCAQQLCHLLLGFAHLGSIRFEFIFVHRGIPSIA